MFCLAYVWYSPTPEMESSLSKRVAIVTGASRGLGRGIAIGLGEQGAIVYVTGRTVGKGDDNNGGVNGKPQVGSLAETCDAVVKAGGTCIPVKCDSASDEELKALFDRVDQEQGRLDIMVNNAFSAVSWLPKTMGKPFWDKGTESWDIVNHVGLRSHYIASHLAAQRMVPRKKGIIINVSSFGGLNYVFDAVYGVGKAAMDRMANDLAIELQPEGVTMVSLWPGLVGTENVRDGALSGGSKPHRGVRPGQPEFDLNELLGTCLSETPLYSGRAVAGLSRDKHKLDLTGKVLPTATLAARYSLTDERGIATPSFTSLKFTLGLVLGKLGLVELKPQDVRPGTFSALFWASMPNLAIPGWAVKIDSGAPNL